MSNAAIPGPIVGPITVSPNDATVGKGCGSFSRTYARGGIAGVLLAKGTFNVHVCWSGGALTRNKLSGITGSIQTQDGVTDKVDYKIGPADAARHPISSKTVYGYHVVVHYFVGIRTCTFVKDSICPDKYVFHVQVVLEPGRAYYSAKLEG